MFKFKLSAILWLLATFVLGQSLDQATLNLMPVPSQVAINDGKYYLTKDFEVSVQGSPNNRIFPAASRFLVKLKNRTGLFITQGFIDPSVQIPKGSLNIVIDRPGEVKFGENESYSLNITTSEIELKSVADIGALRGLETLLQLVSADGNGYYLPEVKINDSPRFPWRGLMIDVARHFQPVEVIKRNIDGMAAVKMNVLHLHLSDDQGFRIESKLYPDLTLKGSDGLFFTQEQIRDIVEYADQRGVRVYPEFDVPGHATAILTAYPQYASKVEDYKIERAAGIFHPTFDPTNPATYEFLNSLFTEMAGLFQDDYFHIGGDENEGKHWDENESIQKFMRKNMLESNADLQAYFNQKLLKNFQLINKKMVGWDEIMHPDLPTTAVIQSWRGLNAMEKAAKSGYKTMLSNGFYIDLMHSVFDHYATDPLPNSLDLTLEERENIIGGEATMWAELVTPNTIDSRIWPRTAAIAERLWSLPSVRDEDNMFQRLAIISLQLEQLGLRHNSMQDVILRSLAQQYDIEPLKVLASVASPLQGYTRNPGGHMYHSYSPFMLFADACIADPPQAYMFNKLVKEYLNGAVLNNTTKQGDAIIGYLQKWKSNHLVFQTILGKAPVLKEIAQLSENLSSLSEAGKEALTFLNEKKRPNKDWIANSKEVVAKSRVQGGRTELRVVDSIEALINASVVNSNLK